MYLVFKLLNLFEKGRKLLDILKLKMKKILGKKSPKIKVIIIFLISCIIIAITSYKEIVNINLGEKIKSQRLYNDL